MAKDSNRRSLRQAHRKAKQDVRQAERRVVASKGTGKQAFQKARLRTEKSEAHAAGRAKRGATGPISAGGFETPGAQPIGSRLQDRTLGRSPADRAAAIAAKRSYVPSGNLDMVREKQQRLADAVKNKMSAFFGLPFGSGKPSVPRALNPIPYDSPVRPAPMQIDPRFAPGRDPFAARRGAMAGLPSYSGPAYPYGPSQVSPAQIAPPAATEALTYGRTPLGYVPEDPRFGPSGPQQILPDGGVMQPMGPAGDPTGQFPYGTVNY